MSERFRLRTEALEWREIEGEIVAADTRAGVYLAGNRTAAVLWPLLAAGTDRAALVEHLVQVFHVDELAAAQDVDRFVATLDEQDLLATEA
jgi:hypothetical protein